MTRARTETACLADAMARPATLAELVERAIIAQRNFNDICGYREGVTDHAFSRAQEAEYEAREALLKGLDSLGIPRSMAVKMGSVLL